MKQGPRGELRGVECRGDGKGETRGVGGLSTTSRRMDPQSVILICLIGIQYANERATCFERIRRASSFG